MKNCKWLIFILFLIVINIASVIVIHAQNWPCWRGPNGDGTSSETKLPIRWDSVTNVVWKIPVPGKGYSPVLANGLVYMPNDNGVITVIKPGPRFEYIVKNSIGEKMFASPAISNGKIYLRGYQHLFCISDNISL